MADLHSRAISRYRNWYQKLLSLHTKTHRERFAESMEQTFHDLCREQTKAGKSLRGMVLWLFLETFAAIICEHLRTLIMQKPKMMRVAVVTLAILAVPLIAMQFTDEVVWGMGDFLIAGGLLFGTGLTYERVASKGGTTAYRAAVGLGLAAGLLLIWTNLAVGLIGSEENPANLLYGGVLAVGLIGTSLARFQPRGMARTLFATAAAQALVPLFAMMIWRPEIDAGLVGVLIINGFFVALWVISGLLFRHAGHAAVHGGTGG